ncbi:unnamed protein product [Parajaminaea phylloscopi]
MAAEEQPSDEFDALYGAADFDDESLLHVEQLATQQAHAASSQSAQTRGAPALHNGSLAPLLHPSQRRPGQKTPPRKRPRLELSQGHGDRDDDGWEPPEVMWTEGAGYVQMPHSSSVAPEEMSEPGPGDFHITHRGPGRPPALGAGYGQSLRSAAWRHEGTGDELTRKMTQEGSRDVMAPGARDSLRGVEAGGRASLPPAFSSHRESTLHADEMEVLQKAKKEVEETLNKALRDLKERTNRMYQRDGEIKMVRERNDKAEKELAELRMTMQRQQADFQRLLEERDRRHAAEKERLDTNAAFSRLEQETSAKRTVWPASVRRRARLPEGSQPSVSASRYIVPPVAPTTPTKRQLGTPHQSPVRSQRSGSANSQRGQQGEPEESPSRRRTRTLQSGRSGRQTQTRAKQFAGFDNSFADVMTPKTMASRATVKPGAAPNRDVFETHNVDDTNEPGSSQPQSERASPGQQTQKEPTEDWAAKLTASRRHRYFWAVASMARRKSSLCALFLAHCSPAPLAPTSLPSSRYLHEAISSPKLVPQHSSTLHRLLDTRLPSQIAPEISAQLRLACELLLMTVTNSASNSDAEGQFAFLLRPVESPLSLDIHAFSDMEDSDYWDCEARFGETMELLYEDLAVSLRTMLGIFLRLCMFDALQDVLTLISALCVNHPAFINPLLNPCLPYMLQAVQGMAASSDGLASDGPTASPDYPRLPTSLESCLIEVVRKCSVLPLGVAHPPSATTASNSPAVNDCALPGSTREGLPAATQTRKTKKKREQAMSATGDSSWDMGLQLRESTLLCVVDLLDVLVWEVSVDFSRHLKDLLEEPGFIATFLDSGRTASTMARFLRLLTRLVQQSDCWKTVLACRFDPNLQPKLPSLVTSSRTPLLELLSKHLVDSRSKQRPSDAHSLHCAIIMLLSQLTISHKDALLMARSSKSILAALVQSIHLDTSYIWNDDGCGRSGRDNRQADVCNRIVMDVRLLARIYGPSSTRVIEAAQETSQAQSAEHSGQDAERDRSAVITDQQHVLSERLNAHDSHMLLNGIRHCFILSFSRLAFADEPSWLEEACIKEMQGLSDICSDLLETVLNPEEVEGAWELCATNTADDNFSLPGEEEELAAHDQMIEG